MLEELLEDLDAKGTDGDVHHEVASLLLGCELGRSYLILNIVLSLLELSLKYPWQEFYYGHFV